MTTYTQTREEIRIARTAARRARVRAERNRKIRRFIYLAICWLQNAAKTFPTKLRRGAIDLFSCTICLIICAAVFFVCLGLFELALTFWGNIYFG